MVRRTSNSRISLACTVARHEQTEQAWDLLKTRLLCDNAQFENLAQLFMRLDIQERVDNLIQSMQDESIYDIKTINDRNCSMNLCTLKLSKSPK